MFSSVTLIDASGDKTVVSTHRDRVHLKVQDSNLLDINLTNSTADTAYGAYSIRQAKELRDALSAAIADVEARQPGPDVFELVDDDGYLWVFVPKRDAWACAMDLNDPDDEPSYASTAGSIFKGFDAWIEIAAKFGLKA